MSRRVLALLAALLIAPGAAVATSAVRLDGASFPATVVARGTTLRLRGAGVSRWQYLVKLYAAALYVPEGAPFDPRDDVARRLELKYFRGFDGGELRRIADEVLARNFAPEALEPLRGRLDLLHGAYARVRAGDRAVLTYVPGRGTELTLNGRRVALVEGADFARAYFAIWLGERPVDVTLRRDLIGR